MFYCQLNLAYKVVSHGRDLDSLTWPLQRRSARWCWHRISILHLSEPWNLISLWGPKAICFFVNDLKLFAEYPPRAVRLVLGSRDSEMSDKSPALLWGSSQFVTGKKHIKRLGDEQKIWNLALAFSSHMVASKCCFSFFVNKVGGGIHTYC